MLGFLALAVGDAFACSPCGGNGERGSCADRQSQRGGDQEKDSSPGVLPPRTHDSSHKTPTIEKGDADTNGHEPGVYSLVFPDGKESQRVCRIRPITSGNPYLIALRQSCSSGAIAKVTMRSTSPASQVLATRS